MHTNVSADVQTAVPAAPVPSAYVWFVAAIAALGGLLFGWDWVVIGGARQFYEEWFHLTTASQVGWANSCALLGCLLGALLTGYTGDRLGRRRLLLISAILFAVSSFATGAAHSFEAFIFWRILGGVAIGLASSVAPVYIAEVSPAAQRGRLVSLNQFAIVVGILLAQLTNALIARSEAGAGAALAHQWNVMVGWRWMFYAIVFPSALFFVGALRLPESPRWLLAHGDTERGQEILKRIAGQEQAADETEQILTALEQEQSGSLKWSEWFRDEYRRPLLLAVAVVVLQQWSGINILFNYASDVYRSAGYGTSAIMINVVITGTINLAATILSMFLVDSVGRRRLLLTGCIGIGVSHVFCTIAYLHHWPAVIVLALTLTAIACYACTLAPVTWVFVSEIFPMRVRSRGMSLATGALWLASFGLTYTFPLLERSMGIWGTFLLYAAICFLGYLLVKSTVRETKGLRLEELES